MTLRRVNPHQLTIASWSNRALNQPCHQSLKSRHRRARTVISQHTYWDEWWGVGVSFPDTSVCHQLKWVLRPSTKVSSQGLQVTGTSLSQRPRDSCHLLTFVSANVTGRCGMQPSPSLYTRLSCWWIQLWEAVGRGLWVFTHYIGKVLTTWEGGLWAASQAKH